MSGSESQEIDQQVVVFQEQEVLWAKIRGYPWWPAFVDKVHGANQGNDEQIDYTVFFFGDNTHSKLQASKLRRYIDFYTDFFPKAKTNRKLFMSIMKAQQKLKQNGVDVEIFESLRESLKKLKKSKGGFYRADSKVSSQDHANMLNSEISQINKNKKFNHQQKPSNQIFRESPQSKKNTSHEKRGYKRRGRKPKSKNIMVDQSQQIESIEQKKQVFNESEDEKKILQPKKFAQRTRSGRGCREVSYLAEQSKSESQQESQKEQSQSPNKQINADLNKKIYPLRTSKVKPIKRSLATIKKRGRPKKVVEIQKSEQLVSQSISQDLNQQQLPNLQQQKSKRVRPTGQNRTGPKAQKFQKNQRVERVPKPRNNKDFQKTANFLKKKEEEHKQKEAAHPQQELILERVKFCLDKRDELIQYLDQFSLTTNIVQQILDLDVTTVLIDGGQVTNQVIRVLQKLKTALLFKYFPEDIKMKRKYDKFSKKPNNRAHSSENSEQTLDDIQIRKKTILKIEKIVKSVDSDILDIKNKAIQLESYFRRYDEEIGNSYKSIAYRVLRSLKDKTDNIQDLIAKLENGEFEQ